MKAYLSQDALVATFILLFTFSMVFMLMPQKQEARPMFECEAIWFNATQDGVFRRPLHVPTHVCMNVKQDGALYSFGSCSCSHTRCYFNGSVMYNNKPAVLSVKICR